MSSPDPAISDAYVAMGAPNSPPQGSSPASSPAKTPTTAAAPPFGRIRARLPESQARCLLWGYLSVIAGFVISLVLPIIPSVFWGLVAVALAMVAMVVGMGLVIFGMLRNAIRSL